MELCFSIFPKVEKNMPKGRSTDVILESFGPWSTYSSFSKMLGKTAKSLFFDVALNVYKIDQKDSKGTPGTARVVLAGVSRSPGVPSVGLRGGKPLRIVDQIIDQTIDRNRI